MEEFLLLGLYRPSQATGKYHISRSEEALNEKVTWATMQSKVVFVMGELNIDRMKPEKMEAKLLTDIEEVHDLMCLICEPTRITNSTSTLIGILLTIKPDYFERSGTFDSSLGDHHITLFMD